MRLHIISFGLGLAVDFTVSFMMGGMKNISILPGDSNIIVVRYDPTSCASVYANHQYKNGWHIET